MKDDFYIVLPSNSSMDVYPENTSTRFMTYLPHQIVLTGSWTVALTEIQIPLTLQHLGKDSSERMITFLPLPPNDVTSFSYLPAGVYDKTESLIDEINRLNDHLTEHLEFSLTPGRYVKITKSCDCKDDHFLMFSEKLRKILGFGNTEADSLIRVRDSCDSTYPANVLNGLPDYMMIYTNILEYHVTGNVQTPLLRALTLNLDEFTYGSFRVKNFSPPMYLPVLLSSFRSIEIDIRDQFGKPIPFDHGTLTVTLHFKRAV